MSIDPPIIIEHSNLSLAWADLFMQVAPYNQNCRQPVYISVRGFEGEMPPEDIEVRTSLESHLNSLGCYPVDTTAMTIFPFKPWLRRDRPNYESFRDLCMKRLLPRLKQLNSLNQYGTYFERMMGYTGGNHGKARETDQLEMVIHLLRKDRQVRESALQIACFDPVKDHTGQHMRGFPCLQHVGISYGDNGEFALNAFYPTQYVFDRAYGNYLGLCHLGCFLSHETGRAFSCLNCLVGKPSLGSPNKRDVTSLVDVCTSSVGRRQ